MGKLIPTGVIVNIRFNRKFKNEEDLLFMVELSKNIKYIAVSEKKIYYNRRLRADSAYHKKKEKFIYFIKYIFTDIRL